MIFETDQGTLQLISQMTKPGARRLASFLNRCQNLRASNPTDSEIFASVDFHGRDDIINMKLEYKIGKNKILSTVQLRNGALWRRGQLRMPGVVLPATVMISLKGRLIEEIVEGSPFKGFEVTGGIQDGGDAGSLRLRCTAEKTGPITVDIDSAPDVDLETVRTMVMDRLGKVSVEPFAAHVLKSLPIDEAYIVLARLSDAKPGKSEEQVSIRYKDLLDGNVLPKHLKKVGKPETDTSCYALGYGVIRLKLVKAGIQAQCHVAGGSEVTCLIEKGEVHFDHPEGETPTIDEALGFHLNGVTLDKNRIWTYGGMRGHRMRPDTTIAAVLSR